MRIIILSDRIPPENKGGAEAAAWRLALGLKEGGHDVHVIAATDQPAFEEQRTSIPTYHITSDYPDRFRAYLALYRRIRPDVVNAHNVHMHLSYHSLTLAQQMGIGTVFSAHDVMSVAYTKLTHWVDPAHCGVRSPDQYRLPPGYNLKQARFRYNPFRNWIIRNILSLRTAVRVTPSQALREALEANGLPSFRVVPYGFQMRDFSTTEAAVARLRERLGLAGRKVILFAGRLTAAKGVVEILSALDRVVQQVPEALLLVLTAGSIDGQVRQPEFVHLRDNHVRAGGWLTGEDLVAAYHAADVVVSPSIIMDTFPVVNLEAMAAAKPVVATCYGGSPEAVVDGQTGYVVNPFDTDSFSERLIRLLSDDALREQMGEAGRQHLMHTFPIERQVREMVDIYREAKAANAR